MPLERDPASQTTHCALSGETKPARVSQSLHAAEPYGAYCVGPQASQAPSRIRCPGAHLMQLLLSSDGALPSSHSVQRPPAFET